MHLESGRHHRDRQRDDQRPPCPRPRPARAASTASTSTRRSRPSRAPTPTSRCSRPSGRPRDRPGVPLLPALHRVGPHVPPGHRGRSGARDDRTSAGHRLRQLALRLEGLSRPRQPRPADHLHRAFAGLGHADQAAADPGRPFAEPPQAHGVRHPPGGQRAGPGRPGRRWDLPQHPRLRLGLPDRLRHRLFVLRLAAAGQLPLRARRPGGEPAVGSGWGRVAAGGVRQPGDLLGPGRPPAALLLQRDRSDARRPGADTLGDLPRPVHGAVPAERWRILVAGDGDPGARRPPSDRLGLPRARCGAITWTTSTWRWATWWPMSASRRLPTADRPLPARLSPGKGGRVGPRLRRWSRSSPSRTRRAAWPRRRPCSRWVWRWRNRGVGCSWWTSTRRPA